jgi:hypothetical protein
MSGFPSAVSVRIASKTTGYFCRCSEGRFSQCLRSIFVTLSGWRTQCFREVQEGQSKIPDNTFEDQIHTSRNTLRSPLASISSFSFLSAPGNCPMYVGYANRNSVAALRKISPIFEITSPCSRCRTYIVSSRFRLHSRKSRILPNTSSMKSWTPPCMTGGFAFRRGRMKT